MTYRISIKDIEAGVKRLNRLTRSPDAYFTKHADGTRQPIWTGHVPKREAYDRLHAFINGIETARQIDQ